MLWYFGPRVLQGDRGCVGFRLRVSGSGSVLGALKHEQPGFT